MSNIPTHTIDINGIYNILNTAGNIILSSNGNVGVGITSPAVRFHVLGTGRFTGNNAATSVIVSDSTTGNNFIEMGCARGNSEFSTSAVAGDGIIRVASGKNLILQASGSGGSHILIQGSTGNVGIGTTSPNASLHLSSSTSNLPFLHIGNTAGGSGNRVGIRLSPYSVRTGGASSQIIAIDDNNASSHLTFWTADSGNNTTSLERVRINNNGNVGIGTTSPSSKLHIQLPLNTTDSGTGLVNRGLFLQADTPVDDNIWYYYGGVMGSGLSVNNVQSATLSQVGMMFGARGNQGSMINFLTTEIWSQGAKIRMTVDRFGSVGIGTTTPLYRLDVNGTIHANGSAIAIQGGQNGGTGRGLYWWNTGDNNWASYFSQSGANLSISGGTATAGAGFSSWAIRNRVSNDSTAGFIWENSAESLLASIRGSDGLTYFAGNVGIGTNSPNSKLHVMGDIYASGDVMAYSDEKLKTNIRTIENALDKINQVRGVYYTHIETNKPGVGVIAQEIEKILPEVISNNGEYKGVAYGNLVGLLIEAIKELSDKEAQRNLELKSMSQLLIELNDQVNSIKMTINKLI